MKLLMKNLFFKLVFTLLILVLVPSQILANTSKLDFFMNDFYSKSNEASQILKELENNLKEGSRQKVCLKQREAAKLGLLANKSLIKAFEIEGTKPPMEAIKASEKRWESILNEC